MIYRRQDKPKQLHKCDMLKEKNGDGNTSQRIEYLNKEWYVVGTGIRSNLLRGILYCPFCGERLVQ